MTTKAPTYPVGIAVAEECLGTFKRLRKEWRGDNEDEAMRQAMEHALEGWEPPALPARGVGVKPLVWEETEGKSYRQANCSIGQYQISWLVEFECWQLAMPPKAGQAWRGNFSHYPHKDAAKAAAQADYEARILAALEPAALAPTDAAQAREAALREAAAMFDPDSNIAQTILALIGEAKSC